MNLQVKHRRLWKTIRQRGPVGALVRRMPNADIGPYVDVRRILRIGDDGVVLDIEEIGATSRRSTPLLPSRAVEMPDVSIISGTAVGNVNRTPGGIVPIDSDIGNQALQRQRSFGSIVNARQLPRNA